MIYKEATVVNLLSSLGLLEVFFKDSRVSLQGDDERHICWSEVEVCSPRCLVGPLPNIHHHRKCRNYSWTSTYQSHSTVCQLNEPCQEAVNGVLYPWKRFL